MNIDNINATIETIKFNQKLAFYMGEWLGEHRRFESQTNECGTACCLAGYASITKNGGKLVYDADHYTDAMEFLGISTAIADDLFLPGNHISETDKDIAIQVLEHLRDTGEVLWNDLPRKEDR